MGQLLQLSLSDFLSQYTQAQNRLLLFDYDGTLVPFAMQPHLASPPPQVTALLTLLATDKKNDVAIISGRERESLSRWLGTVPCALSAEHGGWVKDKAAPWQLTKEVSTAWKPIITPFMVQQTQLFPGTFLEEKDFSLVWHYRSLPEKLGSRATKQLLSMLSPLCARFSLQLLQGSKNVEVKAVSIHKGVTALHFLKKKTYDFIFVIGDDTTDEDMFAALPNSYSVKVGAGPSLARFTLSSYEDVWMLLSNLTKIHSTTMPQEPSPQPHYTC